MLPITAITKFTLQDYPNHTACIIWFGGCNLRCLYCHNPEFVINKDLKFLSEQEVMDFLFSRKDLLEGVVLSGGECTMSDDIYDFIKRVKTLGFKIKIDTNGCNFKKIQKIVDEKLINAVALDYKSTESKFNKITGSNAENYQNFQNSLEFLIKKQDVIELEIRTTVHRDLLDENEINEIIKNLDCKSYKGTYYIQNFRNDNCQTLGNLEKSKESLKIDQLVKPKNFKIDFRNF